MKTTMPLCAAAMAFAAVALNAQDPPSFDPLSPPISGPDTNSVQLLGGNTNTLQQSTALMQNGAAAFPDTPALLSTNQAPARSVPLLLNASQALPGARAPQLAPGGQGGAMLQSLLVSTHLLNINFADNTKTGPAAIGQGSADYWNPFIMPGETSGTLQDLMWSDLGDPSPVDLTVENAPGYWGQGFCLDPMYKFFVYPLEAQTHITVTIAELPANTYDFYVYATRATENGAPVVEFKRDGVSLSIKGTTLWGSGWYSTYWDEHEQYVRFRNVAVNDQPIVLDVYPDAAGVASLSGIQIVPSSAIPPEAPTVTRLLNIDFGGNGSPDKRGPAAVGVNANDFWNGQCSSGSRHTTLSNLKWADETACTAVLDIYNAPGCWGDTLPDVMFSTYIYATDGGNITLNLAGLPSGICDVYLYGHIPATDGNAIFELWSDEVNWGTKGTSLVGTGPTLGAWEVGQQYVLFKDVTITEGRPIIINAKHDRYGYNNLCGLQIAYTGDADTDGDGLPDGWERRWFNSLEQVASGDADGDGLTNLREYQLGTDPTRADSNANGISDLNDFEEVWMEDSTPQGGYQGQWTDTWNWVPSWSDGTGWGGGTVYPHSGRWWAQAQWLMRVSAYVPNAIHQHFFNSSISTIRPVSGDVLYAYVNLDSTYSPSEVMLQWYVVDQNGYGSWEQRAYWGANSIAWGIDGTASRKYIGPLPAAGNWVRLEVPASAVNLEGKVIEGMAFTLYGGRAAWDSAGTMKTDRDGDGLPDWWEMQYFGNLLQNATGDYDGDGLTELEEYHLGTSPTLADTGATGTSDGYKDADGDGLTNLEEFNLGTDPLQPNVATPAFDPVGGSYVSARTVTITCPTTGATIRYTLDGTEPTGASSLYSAPVLVDHNLALKAKAWRTGWITSDTETESYRIEDPPANQPPAVTLLPPTGTSVLASDTVEMLVEAEDSDGTISKVQLFHGNFKIAETTSSPLRYALVSLPAGSYTFTAKAIDDDGAVTVSPPAVFTVNASGPAVSLVGIQPFFTSNPGMLLASIIGVNPGSLSSLTLNGTPLPLRAGQFPLTVSLLEGENTFTLAARDTQNRTAEASATVYLDSILPVISITAPANNSSFGTTRINVIGTFTETSLKRITVNGVLAFVSGNSWEALNVPLLEGANTITATAEDISGNTATSEITVNGAASPVDPVQLEATPVGGFVSLQVTLTPHSSAPGTLQQVLYDFNGDNIVDQTAANLSPINHTYSAPGEYFPVVTVATSSGRFSSPGGWKGASPGLRINVQTPPSMLNSIAITDPVDLKTAADGHLYVLSRSAATITEYDGNLAVVRSKSAIGATPTGLEVDTDGHVYVALSGENHVAKFKPVTGTFEFDDSFGSAGLIGSAGSGNGQFNTPYDVALTPSGDEVAVSDSNNHRIQWFATSDGHFVSSLGQQGSGSGQFNTPKGLAYDQAGTLYIADSENYRIVLTDKSAFIGTSGSLGSTLGQFTSPVNLSVGLRGIYVADMGNNNRIQIFDPPANNSTPFTPRLSIAAETSLNHAESVAAAQDLLQEKVYIADTGNNRVMMVTLPAESPLTAWNDMVAHMSAGHIDEALPSFSRLTAEGYRQAFLTVGASDAAVDINGIGVLTPVFIKNDAAEYYFEKTIQGHVLLFTIDFIKENGAWKIMEF